MRYPPRLGHLATRKVVIAKLLPTFAQAHQIDDEEAARRLDIALSGRLLEDLLASTWNEMVATKGKKRSDEQMLEKVALSLRDRPQRPGRLAPSNPAWSAFLVLADLEAGTAPESARTVLQSEQGRKMAAEGLAEAGRHLARELTRGP